MVGATGVAILILHALMMAFIPAQILLLADHDHLTLGVPTAEEWQAHLHHHLQEAQDYLAGRATAIPAPQKVNVTIASEARSVAGIVKELAPALVAIRFLGGAAVEPGDRAVCCAGPFARTPASIVPRLPPR